MKALTSPEEAKRAAENEQPLAYVIGNDVNPAGVVTHITNSGKTIHTSRGFTFNLKRSQGRFTLKGFGDSDCVVLPSMGSHVGNHRIMIRKSNEASKGKPGWPKGKPRKVRANSGETSRRGRKPMPEYLKVRNARAKRQEQRMAAGLKPLGRPRLPDDVKQSRALEKAQENLRLKKQARTESSSEAQIAG